MGADNWAKCPKCIAKLGAAYQYIDVGTTLREDYEIFMDEKGKLNIDYSCSCKECDFKHSQDSSRQVL